MIQKRFRWVQLFEELGNARGMLEIRHFPADATQVVEAVSRARVGWSAREKRRSKTSPNRKVLREYVQLLG